MQNLVKLVEQLVYADRLNRMSTQQLCNALLTMWADLPVTSKESAIISEAMERLRICIQEHK